MEKSLRALLVVVAAALAASACGGGQPGGPARDVDAGGLPQHDFCFDLAPEYAGGSCESSCPPVPCDCEPTAFQVCHSERGCLSALDCEVACEYLVEEIKNCALSSPPCVNDADCPRGRCARHDHEPVGQCSSGDKYGICFDDNDCLVGACVGETTGRTAACSSGELGAWCDESGCAGSLRCVTPMNWLVGLCQDGSDNGICGTSDDCESPARCVAFNATNGYGSCSLGDVDATCLVDDECNAPLRCIIRTPGFPGQCG